MDNTSILLIRACKSADDITRLKSVYRHRYYTGKANATQVEKHFNFVRAMTSILVNLIDELNLKTKLSDTISWMTPYNYVGNPLTPTEFLEKRLNYLIHVIAHTETSKLVKKGYKPGIKWRKLEIVFD